MTAGRVPQHVYCCQLLMGTVSCFSSSMSLIQGEFSRVCASGWWPRGRSLQFSLHPEDPPQMELLCSNNTGRVLQSLHIWLVVLWSLLSIFLAPSGTAAKDPPQMELLVLRFREMTGDDTTLLDLFTAKRREIEHHLQPAKRKGQAPLRGQPDCFQMYGGKFHLPIWAALAGVHAHLLGITEC